MAEAAIATLPEDTDFSAIAVTNYENMRTVDRCTVIAAGHPTPDENGLGAGRLIRSQLLTAGAADHVLCLISGGGSALLPAPLPGISLADKVQTNDLLLSNGFDITEINLIRQHLSLLKGGGLSRAAAPAPVRTLAISDVIGDDPRTIASGPTAAPLGTVRDAMALLRDRNIWSGLPKTVRKALEKDTSHGPVIQGTTDYSVICSNQSSLKAIARAATDWSPEIVSSHLSGDVKAAARTIDEFVTAKPVSQKQLFIWGGETTVTLTGKGKGGRNQELALRLALAIQSLPGTWVFLSGGTDGRDGPTDAAGGIVDCKTARAFKEQKINALRLLQNNDSYTALHSIGDLLLTGPTGTNVADIQLFLRL